MLFECSFPSLSLSVDFSVSPHLVCLLLFLDENVLPLPGLDERSVAGSQEVNCACNPGLNGA